MSMTASFTQVLRVACRRRQDLRCRANPGGANSQISVDELDSKPFRSAVRSAWNHFREKVLYLAHSILAGDAVRNLVVANALGSPKLLLGARVRSGERWLRQHIAILEDGAHAYA